MPLCKGCGSCAGLEIAAASALEGRLGGRVRVGLGSTTGAHASELCAQPAAGSSEYVHTLNLLSTVCGLLLFL